MRASRQRRLQPACHAGRGDAGGERATFSARRCVAWLAAACPLRPLRRSSAIAAPRARRCCSRPSRRPKATSSWRSTRKGRIFSTRSTTPRSRRQEGFWRMRELAPDRFYASEYYRSYYSQTGLAEEVGFFVPLPGKDALVLSLMRLRASGPFGTADARLLRDMAPAVIGFASCAGLPLPADEPDRAKPDDGRSGQRIRPRAYLAEPVADAARKACRRPGAAGPFHGIDRPGHAHRAGNREGPPPQHLPQAQDQVAGRPLRSASSRSSTRGSGKSIAIWPRWRCVRCRSSRVENG